MPLFDKLFKRKAKPSQPDNGTYIFTSTPSQLSEVVLGDRVNIWNEPKTSLVKVFKRGTHSGEGELGHANQVALAAHLNKGGLYHATIFKMEESMLWLKVDLIEEFQTKENLPQRRKAQFEEEIQKPYKPRKGWKESFEIDPSFAKKTSIKIKCVDQKRAIELGPESKETIWVECNGVNISKPVYWTAYGYTRILRAFYSNLQLEVSYSKKTANHLELIIEIAQAQ